MTKEIPKDNKLLQKDIDIVLHSSGNKAVEVLKGKGFAVNDFYKSYEELVDYFYADWVKRTNEARERSELKRCELCGSSMVRKTGKSKAGADYDFYGCSGYPNCKNTEDIVKQTKIDTSVSAEEREIKIGSTPLPEEQ